MPEETEIISQEEYDKRIEKKAKELIAMRDKEAEKRVVLVKEKKAEIPVVAPTPIKKDPYKCSECGYEDVDKMFDKCPKCGSEMEWS